ncbi:MAG TPA: hypothetical protein PK214_13435, partial [Ottowia sp.]|nr:hypothetical protein [Ottowia sp.]
MNELIASERVVKTRPIEAQTAAVAGATARICNEERARFGGSGGREVFFHRLSGAEPAQLALDALDVALV